MSFPLPNSQTPLWRRAPILTFDPQKDITCIVDFDGWCWQLLSVLADTPVTQYRLLPHYARWLVPITHSGQPASTLHWLLSTPQCLPSLTCDTQRWPPVPNRDVAPTTTTLGDWRLGLGVNMTADSLVIWLATQPRGVDKYGLTNNAFTASDWQEKSQEMRIY